jgi:hypothetical protein
VRVRIRFSRGEAVSHPVPGSTRRRRVGLARAGRVAERALPLRVPRTSSRESSRSAAPTGTAPDSLERTRTAPDDFLGESEAAKEVG